MTSYSFEHAMRRSMASEMKPMMKGEMSRNNFSFMSRWSIILQSLEDYLSYVFAEFHAF